MKKALGLAVLILMLPFLINIPDATLNDEAARIITAVAEPMGPQADNGYYALLGFAAPPGKDMVQAGQEVHAAHAAAQKGNRFDMHPVETDGASLETPPPGRIPRCIPDKQECLGFYREQEELLMGLSKAHALLLDRYQSLGEYAFFQDVAGPGARSLRMRLEGAVLAGHLLTAGNAALLFNNGLRSDAVQLLAADIMLWRKLLAGASDLPGKTDAFLALRLNYSLLNEMVDVLPEDATALPDKSPVLDPLSIEERSTQLVWDRHLRGLAWSLGNDRWPPEDGRSTEMSFLERSFTKTNATLNKAHALFGLLAGLSIAGPDEVENLRMGFAQQLEQVSKPGLSKICNPLGKGFLAASFDERAGVNWNGAMHALDQSIAEIRNKVRNHERATEITPAADMREDEHASGKEMGPRHVAMRVEQQTGNFKPDIRRPTVIVKEWNNNSCPPGSEILHISGDQTCVTCIADYMAMEKDGRIVCQRQRFWPLMRVPDGYRPDFHGLDDKGRCLTPLTLITLHGRDYCIQCEPGYRYHDYYGQGRCLICEDDEVLEETGGKIMCLKCPGNSMMVPDFGFHGGIYCRCMGAMIFGWGDEGYGCYVP